MATKRRAKPQASRRLNRTEVEKSATSVPAEAGLKKLEPEIGQAALDRVAERYPELRDKAWARAQRSPTAKLTCTNKGSVVEITKPATSSVSAVDDSGAQLIFNGSLGSTDTAFADALVSQIGSSTSGRSAPDPLAFGLAMAVVQGVEPRDEVEAMLAAQMAMVHLATMRFASKLQRVETIAQQDSAANALNKLARTFAAQMEALKRYRSTGEQKVTVQHVTVNNGGQAVVGHVSHRGRGSGLK